MLPRKSLPILLAVAWALSWGCSQTDVQLGEEAPDAQQGFTPPVLDASVEAGPDARPEQLLACIGTECPYPFATCASGNGPSYKCGTDLAHDSLNCGACGNKCLVYEPLKMTSRCVDGACELECMNDPSRPTDRRNCNGEIDDGCEVDVLVDPNNCGACGKVCPGGQPCVKGKCACPPGQLACNGACVDPNRDDENCGGCGNACKPPPGACATLPPRTYYGCEGGSCGLKCMGASADCNGDVATEQCASNGCEVLDLKTDRNNCGGCGIACKANEECIYEGFGRECAVPCTRFGKVFCPSLPVDHRCVDLLTDPHSCGGCGNVCPAAGPNQIRSCNKGMCDLECAPGFADCNGNATDGCEVNLNVHPSNCGACGNRCDIAAGQPCVEGKCLMTTCDGKEIPQ
ncbi:MAG: hypothetical protein J0I07_24700 [Myxococcales bacterium]|nr:hypothetical protein [Myxococcales bacterium]